MVRLRANGRNIVDQPLPTLLDVTCCVHLHTLLHVVVCCCAKFETGQTFQPTTPNTSFLLRDRRSVAQQCWIRLRSSSNIVGATHAHYAWFTKSYGLYPSHYALQVPTLLGAVAFVCAPVLGVVACVCWKRSANGCNNSQQCWDLQCIVRKIQPIRLWRPCVLSVRGPNNVGRAANGSNIVALRFSDHETK